jgi:lysophospholipase L1-like esterase
VKGSPYAVVLWTLGLLAVAELGLEWRAAARGWETLLFGAPAASRLPADSPFGRTADFPFRSRVVEERVPPGVTRLWLASASYAEHIFLPPEQIFPVLLEDELRRRGHQVEVLNASRAAQGIPAAAAELAELGPRYRPDWVLLYQLSNDVDALTNQLQGETAAGGGTPGAAQPSAAAAPWPTELARRTTLYEQAKNQLSPRLAAARMLRDEPVEGLGPALVRDLADFDRTVRAVGARTLVCTFVTSEPDLGRPLPPDFERKLLRTNAHLSADGWRASIALGNRALAEGAAQLGLPLLDLLPAAPQGAEFFEDLVHFTPIGHRAMAQVLADQLEPWLGAGRTGAPERGGR